MVCASLHPQNTVVNLLYVPGVRVEPLPQCPQAYWGYWDSEWHGGQLGTEQAEPRLVWPYASRYQGSGASQLVLLVILTETAQSLSFFFYIAAGTLLHHSPGTWIKRGKVFLVFCGFNGTEQL